MDDFLKFIAVVILITIVCAEVPLFLYRKIFRKNRAYPIISAIVRATAYSPCILGAGHGAMPLLLGPALWLLLTSNGGDVVIVWFYGIPEVLVGVICLAISTPRREDTLLKKEANKSSPPTSPSGRSGSS